MTTEVWIPGFRDNTLKIIPDGKRLDSFQKSSLILELKLFSPPSGRQDSLELSPIQFGQIIDKFTATSITTKRPVSTGVYDSSSDKFSQITQVIRHVNPWDKPIIIHSDQEIAAIHLPGYGKRYSVFIRHLSTS